MLGAQRLESLADESEWIVPNTKQDDGVEVASGAKVLNKARINWYWIPPKPCDPNCDPNSKSMSPLVLDHVVMGDG